MTTAIFTIVAYLIGSISFAVVMSRLFSLSDPRTYGSKNPGATNVLRSGNKGAAIATLIGDAAKGWFAVWLAMRLAGEYGVGTAGIALVAVAVFLGHLWPVFFRFVGGKGVATILGVLLGINVWLGLAVLATWLVVAFTTRYSSLAALVAAILAPIYYGMAFGIDELFFAVVAMSSLLLFRHNQNIANLMAGKESKIGSKSAGAKK
ncbi:glycerol-3-phosphate 1-O-acyltransferase PlsY [Massilia sp. P8910]|uniref:glycerol-3-phosphate 1-O-acyltransferase PlsY n=1 Tax=Massilia antarctica TaxID=2765360 RepID=UPI0006BB5F70|nr:MULTISPECIES: glycerol-3-phosphate 1-O-acyltransferase PlsY [Massilia]MCE3605865.1 glycerol-3-phosphate 1-O-acyltransferase PlsY [Massilia antarctica]MCY0911001.1 glycerol-3-phosphate 1-O-acyltransferase PlsY [Massilia sp. H27-R4]CUI09797.1 Acyl-phosphate:glycerol-3-phosphate O-acyltransferase PlsY [Janthinobacterium sp. CG23_2]CUU33583.1 Acyl-phosphate:glycerol-3-phosphate O-acyltransferase PlsY [Janthinobacterium sp. CG23_2]